MGPVLVTGARGLVGSALVRAGGSEVLGTSHTELDIVDDEAVAHVLDELRPSAVINAAAMARVDRADEEPDLAWAVNALAPGSLARACARRSIRLVHLSTDYVLTGPESAGRLTEALPPDPRSTYARSKLKGEQEALSAGAVVVRVQWVYWPGAPGFFTTVLQRLSQGQPVLLVEDQVGSPTPAGWLAQGLLRCARNGPTGLFHLASGGETSAAGWIRSAAALLDLPFDSARAATRADLPGAFRPARSCLDSTRFSQAWALPIPAWDEALREALTASRWHPLSQPCS